MTILISAAIKKLKNHDYAWDIDDNMDELYVQTHPLFELVNLIHSYDREILFFLLYSLSLRVLPCWEITCKDIRPRYTLKLITQVLKNRINKDQLLYYTNGTDPCVNDLSHSEIYATSDAIAHSALYILNCSPKIAAFSVSFVNVAFEHIFIEDKFKEWFFEYALPISFEKRFIEFGELRSYAVNDYTLKAYENIIDDVVMT